MSQSDPKQPSANRLPMYCWLFFWLIAVSVVALIGANSPPDAWFEALRKPSFNPPGAVFGPVWTLLYLLMAIAAWLVVKQTSAPRQQRRTAMGLMGLQLFLNALWSPLFFGLHSPGWAFVDICLLWLAIVVTIKAFAAIRPAAAWMLAPYVLWVSFALVLNGTIWMMNRAAA